MDAEPEPSYLVFGYELAIQDARDWPGYLRWHYASYVARPSIAAVELLVVSDYLTDRMAARFAARLR